MAHAQRGNGRLLPIVVAVGASLAVAVVAWTLFQQTADERTPQQKGDAIPESSHAMLHSGLPEPPSIELPPTQSVAPESPAVMSTPPDEVHSLANALDTAILLLPKAISGECKADDVLAFADQVLASASQSVPVLDPETGMASVTLLDDPDRGKITITASPASAGTGLATPGRAFGIEVDLYTRPGFVTGLADDGAKRSVMNLGFQLSADGTPQTYSLISEARYKPSSPFLSQLGAVGPTRYGGTILIGPAGAEYYEETLSARKHADGVSRIASSQGNAVVIAGSLSDPRATSIAEACRRMFK